MLVSTSTLLLLLLALMAPLSAEAIVDEEVTFHRKLASRLLKHCLQDDVWACVAFKGHNILEGHTSSSSEDFGERQVDKQLQGAFGRVLDQYIGLGGMASSQARGKLKFLGPLLGGIILKFVALIPVVLGILAFLGIQSVIASKISLGIAALVGLKKLYQGDVQLQPGLGLEAYQFPFYQQQQQQQYQQYLDPYHAAAGLPEGHHGLHEHAGLAQRRRVFVIRKGKELEPNGDERHWSESEPWSDNSV